MEPPQVNQGQDIKTQLQSMINLQHVDDDINAIKAQIEALQEKSHKEEEHVNEKKAGLSKVKTEVDNLLKDKRESEGNSKQLQEQISKLNGQLYDVKTNEALRALQAEIKQKKQDNGTLEEHIIEMMMAEDELKVDLKKADEELKAAEKLLAEAQAVSHKEAEGLKTKIGELEVKWEEASKKVNRHLLERYIKLRDGRQGKAMAKVEHDVCSGCQMSIPAQMFIELKKYREFHTCSNCARFLYTED